jgi:hypothetical protein
LFEQFDRLFSVSTSMESFKQLADNLIAEMLPPLTNSATMQRQQQRNINLTDDDVTDPSFGPPLLKLLTQLGKAPNASSAAQLKTQLTSIMRKRSMSTMKQLQQQVATLK